MVMPTEVNITTIELPKGNEFSILTAISCCTEMPNLAPLYF